MDVLCSGELCRRRCEPSNIWVEVAPQATRTLNRGPHSDSEGCSYIIGDASWWYVFASIPLPLWSVPIVQMPFRSEETPISREARASAALEISQVVVVFAHARSVGCSQVACCRCLGEVGRLLTVAVGRNVSL